MSSAVTGVVLNGSPHPEGNTVALARHLTRRLSCRIRFYHLYNLPIAACTGCGGCDGGGDCVIDDGMLELWRGMAEADVVILASPLHFTSLSAPLVAAIGRLQPSWQSYVCHGAGRLPEKIRLGALVVTAGSRYPNMFAPARAVAAAAFKSLGIEMCGMATASGLDADGEFSQTTLEEIDGLATAIRLRLDQSR